MGKLRWVHVGVPVAIGCLILIALAAARPVAAGLGEMAPQPTPTTVPFLRPPFARTYRVTSYFDHHFPDRAWDDTIVIYDGERASAIDGIMDRLPTFRGGYWLPETRWYVYYDGHNAFDYGTGAGTTILAAAPGKVVFADTVPSSCATPLQYVCVEHSNGYRTYYLHLEGICVRRGQWVEAGDPLGISGNSGCSLGAHLHFAVEYDNQTTDPYGWQPTDEPDPLIEQGGVPATWLWLPDQPQLPLGRLEEPAAGTETNGDLRLSFVPAADSPPVARVEFLAFYQDEWHSLGQDGDGADGWSMTWNTRGAPEGEAWLHAWAIGTDGRVGKGSPIRKGIVVDRRPPQGYIIGLQADALGEPSAPEHTVAGSRLWLYAASYDPDSNTQQVTFLLREQGGSDWREIGNATWMHTSNWVLQWDADLADGAQFDVVARLTDGAGNAALTQPVEGIALDRRMPQGELVRPAPGTALTTTTELVFSPSAQQDALPIDRVAFYVWHDGAWHLAGVDRDGSDGWQASWDPAQVADQDRVRMQARVYDAAGRANMALPQVTALVLDRTPPSAGYVRPATGGVARPDVDQQVWAWDGGSGVDHVEFFVHTDRGWLKIGQDDSVEEGWSVLWDGQGFVDGLLTFSAQVFDRAGNVKWTTDVRDVAFDRSPPVGTFAFPAAEALLSSTITLTLDVTDTVSGLDRAIFYAHYQDKWHHLGADLDGEDGFSVAWDTSRLAGRNDVTLTAWVYDRAGNSIELPHVQGIAIGSPDATVVPSRATTLPSPASTPVPDDPSPTPPAQPSDTPGPLATNTTTPTHTPVPPAVPAETPSYTPVPEPSPTQAAATSSPQPSHTPVPSATAVAPPIGLPSVPPAFWYLIGAGAVVAAILMAASIRSLSRTRR